MGNEISNSQINSLASLTDLPYNNLNDNFKLGKLIFQKENENTLINRVWIVKRSISENQGKIKALYLNLLPSYEKVFKNFYLPEPRHNVFNIKNEFKSNLKHWALILELSNGSYVNIQFGETGLSLKEFNKTNIPGESVLNAILETWGEDGHPFSFCFLGNANYKYQSLKNYLEFKKYQEIQTLKIKRNYYYSFAFNNCHDSVYDIELFLFRYNRPLHLFNYYLNKFFKKFFPKVNIDVLKKKYEEDLEKINNKLFKKNMDAIDKIPLKVEKEIKEEKEKMIFENKLIWLKNKVKEIYSHIEIDS